MVFDVPFRGSFVTYVVMCLFFFLASFCLGLVMSVFMRTQAVALLAGLMVLMFPAMFLSGIFYPIASMPAEMQMESQFLPSTPMVAAARGIMVKGQTLAALRPQAMTMLGSALVYLAVSIKVFKKKV